MDDTADRSRSTTSLLRSLFWTKLGLLLAAALGVAVVMLLLTIWMDSGAWHDFSFAIGTGLLAAVLLTSGQHLLMTKSTEDILVNALTQENEKAWHSLTDVIRGQNTEFYPTNVFEATNKPDPHFNRVLMADLADTRQFLFRGISARHTAARLLVSRAGDWELKVVIADPCSERALEARARHKMIQSGDANPDPDDIRKILLSDIELGLTGLYLARTKCNRIDIYAAENPPIDRFELFDNSIWITQFSNIVERAKKYPRSLRFSRASYVYTMERGECLRACDSTAKHVTITPHTSNAQFRRFFTEMTQKTVDEAGFQQLVADFGQFKDAFVRTARLAAP